MEISRYNKQPKYIRKALDQGLENAVKFIEEYYPSFNIDNFSEVLIKPSNTCRFAQYCPIDKTIRLDLNHSKWWTYKKKTVGLYADGIYIDLIASLSTQLVHEMTHHIQNCEERKYSEVETTKNEIEWMRVHRPDEYSKLKSW
jgi:hypothetical protein